MLRVAASAAFIRQCARQDAIVHSAHEATQGRHHVGIVQSSAVDICLLASLLPLSEHLEDAGGQRPIWMLIASC